MLMTRSTKADKDHRLSSLSSSLSNLLDQTMEASQSHGIQLSLSSPKFGLQWQGARGFIKRAAEADGSRLTVNHPIRIASITKTFIAAAILRLWEQNKLSLDDTLEKYLSSEHRGMLSSSAYAIEKMTIRHLLSHTSGLFDYADCPDFEKAIHQTPQRNWTRTDQLKLAMEAGAPYGDPGEVYRYCDTGYILLGEIVEEVSGRLLGTAVRQLLNYSKIGLENTWWESSEASPSEILPLTHQYEGELDYHRLNVSCDSYGGGGLISTVNDLVVFMRALFSNNVYQQPSTLITMLSTVATNYSGPDYGGNQLIPCSYRLGIDGGHSGRIYQHKGHTGTLAAFVPEQDIAISFSLNQARYGSTVDHRDVLLRQLLSLFSYTHTPTY